MDENIYWFIFPTWIPGHWMVCVSHSKSVVYTWDNLCLHNF